VRLPMLRAAFTLSQKANARHNKAAEAGSAGFESERLAVRAHPFGARQVAIEGAPRPTRLLFGVECSTICATCRQSAPSQRPANGDR
jgi:hypothetical protein